MKLSMGSVNGRNWAVVVWGAMLAGVLVLGGPPEARAQSSGLPELEIVTADSEHNGVPDKGAGAVCPAGKTPLGGGAQVLGNIGHVFLQFNGAPKNPGTTWAAQAEKLDGTDPWHVQARAMCVPAGLASDSGLEVVDAQSGDNSIVAKAAEAVCPAGKTVIGGGALVLGNIGHVFLRESYRKNDTTWVGAAEAFDQTNPWRVLARAVCVSTGFAADRGLEVVTAESADDAVADKWAWAKCPAGKTAIGGGAHLIGNIRHVFLQKTAPGSGSPGDKPDDEATTWGVWAQSLEKDTWHVRAQVFCVTRLAAPPTTPTTAPPLEPAHDPGNPDGGGGGDGRTTQGDPTTPVGGVRTGAGGTAQHATPVLPVGAGALGAALVGCGLWVRRRARR